MSLKPQAASKPIQPSNWSIAQLPGLSHEDISSLASCGITTTQELLQTAKNLEAKQVLANQLQININHINKWVAMADLSRIPDVGCQYCGLLLHAGIASVVQLSQTPAHRLHRQILKFQVATMQRKDLCPSVGQVTQWIQRAKVILNL